MDFMLLTQNSIFSIYRVIRPSARHTARLPRAHTASRTENKGIS